MKTNNNTNETVNEDEIYIYKYGSPKDELKKKRREVAILSAQALRANFKNNEERYKKEKPEKVEELRKYTIQRIEEILNPLLIDETIYDIPEIVSEIELVKTVN